MWRYFVLICLAVSMSSPLFLSCKAVEKVVYVERVDSVYVQKLVPVVLPPDTAFAHALLECNEQGRVTLSKLYLETTKNALLTFKLDSIGTLDVNTTIKRDTVWIKSDSIYVYKDKTETLIQVEEVEKKLGKWDSFILRFGNWMFGGLCALFIWGIVRLYLKIKKVF